MRGKGNGQENTFLAEKTVEQNERVFMRAKTAYNSECIECKFVSETVITKG